METLIDDDSLPDEELYAILGVSKNVSIASCKRLLFLTRWCNICIILKQSTTDEINSAYRRLSRQFHPDKHSSDPQQQRDALIIFNKVKQAHEILTDEHKRAIYDTVGRRGLDVGQGIVVSRTRSPNEIRDEYLRLVEEKNASRLMMQANHKGAISIRINCTEVFDYLNSDENEEEEDDDYEEEDEEGMFLPLIEVSQMQIGQSINLPLSSSETATFKGNLITQNGRGNGNFVSCFRKVLSDQSWAECQLVIGQGPIAIINGYRSFWQKNHASCSLVLPFHFTHNSIGARVGVEFSYARNLSKQFIATVGVKAGIQAEIYSSLSYNLDNKHQAAVQGTISLKESSLSFSYTRRFENEFKIKLGSKIGTKGLSLEYGCETKVTTNAVVGASMSIMLPSGVSLKLRYEHYESMKSFHVP